MSGRIDRLDDRRGADGSGELVVVDYKTGRHVLTTDDARTSLPLALYALAAERVLRRPLLAGGAASPADRPGACAGSTPPRRWTAAAPGRGHRGRVRGRPTSDTGAGGRPTGGTRCSRRGPAAGAAGVTTAATARRAWRPPGPAARGMGWPPIRPIRLRQQARPRRDRPPCGAVRCLRRRSRTPSACSPWSPAPRPRGSAPRRECRSAARPAAWPSGPATSGGQASSFSPYSTRIGAPARPASSAVRSGQESRYLPITTRPSAELRSIRSRRNAMICAGTPSAAACGPNSDSQSSRTCSARRCRPGLWLAPASMARSTRRPRPAQAARPGAEQGQRATPAAGEHRLPCDQAAEGVAEQVDAAVVRPDGLRDRGDVGGQLVRRVAALGSPGPASRTDRACRWRQPSGQRPRAAAAR